MCGRFVISSPADSVAKWFGTRNATPNSRPSYNVAPTQDILAVRFNPETKERTLDALRWGLVPYWAKDIKIGYSLINAKAETVAEKPAFREAFASRRCLIPADAFYEWKKLDAKTKQPYAITMKDRSLFGFAGLWQHVKREVYALMCTEDKRYAKLRRDVLSYARKGKTPMISAFAAVIGGTLNIAAGLIAPFVALALLAALKIGKEVYCARGAEGVLDVPLEM